MISEDGAKLSRHASDQQWLTTYEVAARHVKRHFVLTMLQCHSQHVRYSEQLQVSSIPAVQFIGQRNLVA